MAGVKGRSGSGGARPGAGRKPKPKPKQPAVAVAQDGKDMLELLQDIALGKIEASAVQVRAAIAAVQYTHTKRCDGGKKEERHGAAKEASGGRFAPSTPPKLVVNNK